MSFIFQSLFQINEYGVSFFFQFFSLFWSQLFFVSMFSFSFQSPFQLFEFWVSFIPFRFKCLPKSFILVVLQYFMFLKFSVISCSFSFSLMGYEFHFFNSSFQFNELWVLVFFLFLCFSFPFRFESFLNQSFICSVSVFLLVSIIFYFIISFSFILMSYEFFRSPFQFN